MPQIKIFLKQIILFTFSTFFVSLSARAEELNTDQVEDLPTWAKPATDSGLDDTDKAQAAEEIRVASSKRVRRFHEVLDELLAEFGYDIKQGQIDGLRNLAVRKISVNESLPGSYANYLEILLAERVKDNSRIKIISCIPCKSKVSTVVDGKLLISSPSTNLSRLDEAADQMGISHFMDAVLMYHPTHMVLAVEVFDTKSKEQVWTRTYNSETVKSRYQKLAVDYSQVAKSRPGEEYVPEYKFLMGFGGAGIPNIGGDSSDSAMVNVQLRATERFNSRRSEFGLLLSNYIANNSIFKKATKTDEEVDPDETNPTPLPFKNAVAFYAIYAHNFIGAIESYNDIRYGINFGVGGLLASQYLAGSARLGWDTYFGRRFVASISVLQLGSSTVTVNEIDVKTKGGTGGEMVISYNF